MDADDRRWGMSGGASTSLTSLRGGRVRTTYQKGVTEVATDDRGSGRIAGHSTACVWAVPRVGERVFPAWTSGKP
jgi:hypothetical protein